MLWKSVAESAEDGKSQTLKVSNMGDVLLKADIIQPHGICAKQENGGKKNAAD